MSSQQNNNNELSAIIQRLKQNDYTGYLTIRFSPENEREKLTWLYGFFMDVGQISTKVKEPFLGEIRLQWWRDQLGRLFRGEAVGHPVADGLAPFVGDDDKELHKALVGIVDSYLFEVQSEPLKNKDELFDVLDLRYGGLIRASLLLCNANTGSLDDNLCRDAGIAIGLSEVLANLPVILHHGIMPLPQDLLQAAELFHEDFMAKEKTIDRSKIFQQMCEGAILKRRDIKQRLKTISRKDRILLARWLLVPSILDRAIEERQEGLAWVTTLNPLKIFFTMFRGSF